MFRSKLSSLWFAVALILAVAVGSPASAQKAARTRSGVKVKTWKAKGTKFEHRTHGNSRIGWERRATRKDGVVNISGKLWGSKIKGQEASRDGKTISFVNATSPTGQTRKTTTFKDRNGTERKTIEMKPEGVNRRITTWRVGKTEMTSTRDYDAKTGKLIKKQRTGQKAR